MITPQTPCGKAGGHKCACCLKMEDVIIETIEGWRVANEMNCTTNANRIRELKVAVEAMYSAMVMQEKRERGEFHIPRATAINLWNEAKSLAERAVL